MQFRPALIPTIMTVPMFVVMVSLGIWQLDRLAWKTAILDNLSERLSQPAIPAPGGPVDPVTDEFLKVTLTGTWMHDKEMLILSRPEKGTPGMHVITPLQTPDGRQVIVNRGWVPEKQSDPKARPASLIEGPVTIEGMIRTTSRRGWFRPDNEPERNLWLYEDPKQMADFQGLSNPEPYLVVQIETGGALRLPVPAKPERVLSIRNEHLSYAVTWFGMALGLLIIYGVWHRQQGRLTW